MPTAPAAKFRYFRFHGTSRRPNSKLLGAGANSEQGAYLEEAEAYVEHLEDLGLNIGLDRMVAAALNEGLVIALCSNDFSKSEECLRRLQLLWNGDKNDDSQSQSQENIVDSFGAETELQTYLLWASIRYQLALSNYSEAIEIMAKALAIYTKWGRYQEVTRLYWLMALSYQKMGRQREALELAEKCLTNCQKLGLVRTIWDEGSKAQVLIQTLAKAPNHDALFSAYLDKLLWEFLRQEPKKETSCDIAQSHTPDLLSKRELEILRLLANALTNKKMAISLGVTPETIKWHLKNIYGKLQVMSRDQAVAKGRDLGLLNS